VVGRLKQDRWQDPEGKPHSKIKIIAEHIEFKPDFSSKRNSDKEKETPTPETEEQLEAKVLSGIL
jgi:single-strand DNA-binding protein